MSSRKASNKVLGAAPGSRSSSRPHRVPIKFMDEFFSQYEAVQRLQAYRQQPWVRASHRAYIEGRTASKAKAVAKRRTKKSAAAGASGGDSGDDADMKASAPTKSKSRAKSESKSKSKSKSPSARAGGRRKPAPKPAPDASVAAAAPAPLPRAASFGGAAGGGGGGGGGFNFDFGGFGAAAPPPLAQRQSSFDWAFWGAPGAAAAVKQSAPPVPAVWRFDSGSPAFGLCVDSRSDRLWAANNGGEVYALNLKSGSIEKKIQLAVGVKAVVSDSQWIYAGCDNGTIYDLSHEVVRVAYRFGKEEGSSAPHPQAPKRGTSSLKRTNSKAGSAAAAAAADQKDVKSSNGAAAAANPQARASGSGNSAVAAGGEELDSIPPKHLVFAIDCSGSMEGPYLHACIDNMELMVNTMVRPDDRVSLIRFRHYSEVIFTAQTKRDNYSTILNGIRNCTASGGTAFWAALRDALSTFGASDDTYEQWVVALTDGEDTTNSAPTAIDIAALCRASAANLLCIGVGSLSTADEIKSVCEATKNGMYLPVTDTSKEGLDEAFKTVTQLLASRIAWMDVLDGWLAVSGVSGSLTVCNMEGEKVWSRAGSSDARGGWMCRADPNFTGIYHSAGTKINKWKLMSGDPVWSTQHSKDQVLFGWQDSKEYVYAAAGNTVYRLRKDTGALAPPHFNCDRKIVSNATADSGDIVFAADTHSNIYCFSAAAGSDGSSAAAAAGGLSGGGALKWKLSTGCGAALSMSYVSATERLYIVTTKGAVMAIDTSTAAIQKALSGAAPKMVRTVSITKAVAARVVAPSSHVADTSDAAGGVLVECVAEKGGKLRIRPISHPFNPSWNTQFPRDLRVAGARFVVENLVPASSGEFYRVSGSITRLVATTRYQKFTAANTASVIQQIEGQGLTFKKGCCYYQHTRSETIQSYKNLVIEDTESGELFAGDVARKLLGLPDDADATKVQPSARHGDRFHFYVQSTSNNRNIKAGDSFLFDSEA